jgi:hypothetical protein
MKFEELKSGWMRVTPSEEERNDLRERRESDPDSWGSDLNEREAVSDSLFAAGYDWVRPEESGDLTSAPMFGLRGSELPIPERMTNENDRGDLCVTYWDNNKREGTFAPVLKRWAYMNYAVRTFLDDMIDDGHADFQNGHEADPMKFLNNMEEELGLMTAARDIASHAELPEPQTSEDYLRCIKLLHENCPDTTSNEKELKGRYQYQIECLEALGVAATP